MHYLRLLTAKYRPTKPIFLLSQLVFKTEKIGALLKSKMCDFASKFHDIDNKTRIFLSSYLSFILTLSQEVRNDGLTS